MKDYQKLSEEKQMCKKYFNVKNGELLWSKSDGCHCTPAENSRYKWLVIREECIKTGEAVADRGDETCALCEEYFDGISCNKCPLAIIDRCDIDSSAWLEYFGITHEERLTAIDRMLANLSKVINAEAVRPEKRLRC